MHTTKIREELIKLPVHDEPIGRQVVSIVDE